MPLHEDANRRRSHQDPRQPGGGKEVQRQCSKCNKKYACNRSSRCRRRRRGDAEAFQVRPSTQGRGGHAKKSLPSFKVLKSSKNFQWGPEQDKAFEDLKQYLENLAVMTSPSPEAELLLYITTSSSAVSAALVEECNTRFIKEHKLSNHIRARIKSHVYTTE